MDQTEPYSHPRCYAGCRQDCSKELSSEHFLSRALLEYIEAPAGGIYVRGFPWQKTEVMKVGINSLASNILCRRHNSQLSILDAEALQLAQLLERWVAQPAGIYLDTVQGPMIERYLLKAMCGVMASRSACVDGARIDQQIPGDWIGMLFGDQPLPPGWGLKVNAEPDDRWAGDTKAYQITPILGDGAVVGVIATLRGLRLSLLMTRPVPNIDQALGAGPVFRPNCFDFRHRKGKVSIKFRW